MSEAIQPNETAVKVKREERVLRNSEGAITLARKRQRRRIWINDKFQRRFLLSILLIEVEVAAATAGLLSLGWVYMLSSETSNGVPMLNTLLFFFAIAVVLLITSGFLALYISHRICGPIYRVMECLKALQRGEQPRPIKLRQGDDFFDLAETVNQTIEMLRERESAANR